MLENRNNLNGFWKAFYRFSSGVGGSGVVVFIDGQLYGGDQNFYYRGTVELKQDGMLVGTIKAIQFGVDNTSIFGLIPSGQALILEMKGNLQSEVVRGQLRAEACPRIFADFALHRI